MDQTKKDLKERNEAKGHQMELTIGYKTRHQESSFRYFPDLGSSPPVLELLQIFPECIRLQDYLARFLQGINF